MLASSRGHSKPILGPIQDGLDCPGAKGLIKAKAGALRIRVQDPGDTFKALAALHGSIHSDLVIGPNVGVGYLGRHGSSSMKRHSKTP